MILEQVLLIICNRRCGINMMFMGPIYIYMSDHAKLGSQLGSLKLSNIYVLSVKLIWEMTVVPLQREWLLHDCHSRSVYITLVAMRSKQNSIFGPNWHAISILPITYWILQLVLLPCSNNCLCHYLAMAPQSTSQWLQMRKHIYYLIYKTAIETPILHGHS